MPTIRRLWEAGSEADQIRLDGARNDVLLERVAAPGVFEQAEGPFRRYQRRLINQPDGSVTEEISYRVGVPWFGWLFAPFVRWSLRRRPTQGKTPFWAPPDRLQHHHVLILGLLAAAAMSSAFTNTLFTQTANFAADEFGIGNTAQGLAGSIVRAGIVLVLPVALLADRVGRRRMIRFTIIAAPLLSALGALAPSFATLTISQAVARPVGLALDMLIGVVAAEEMPKNSRAYAISVISMAQGLGSGICVMALRLTDISVSAWRYVYLLALIWLIVAWDVWRRLPETSRFEAFAEHREEAGHIERRRLAAQAAAIFFVNMFLAPMTFFQNRYLEDVRGYTGGGIALFTVATATPAGIGLVVGGALADRFGRRVLGSVCAVVGTTFLVLSFGVAGWMMWAFAFLGGLVAGAAVPALGVYRSEMFPTRGRSTASYIVTASALLSGAVSIYVTGRLLDNGWSHFSILGLLALGHVVVVAIVMLEFPESAHRSLEDLNPADDFSPETSAQTLEPGRPTSA
jgi:MFS family permease